MNTLTVVSDDRPGLIAQLCQLLAEGEINIASVHGRTFGPEAVFQLEVDNLPAAISILTQAGCRVMWDDVVTLALENTPGALARVAAELARENLDIRMIRTVSRTPGSCIVAVATDDNNRARSVFADRLL